MFVHYFLSLSLPLMLFLPLIIKFNFCGHVERFFLLVLELELCKIVYILFNYIDAVILFYYSATWCNIPTMQF